MRKLPEIINAITTVRYLKPVQVVYQVKNRLIRPKSLSYFEKDYGEGSKLEFFPLSNAIEVLQVDDSRYCFEFLNQRQVYHFQVDWNDQRQGRLWNYNLQYLDFLRQSSISVKDKTDLLLDLYHQLWSGKLLLEPYPVSLRIMNMIRFLSEEAEDRKVLTRYLSAEVNYLSQHLEYHLMGNHLLENLFTLLMAGNFFQNKILIEKVEKLLTVQLDEQILSDGAHFELSPMYHQLLFFRLLEAVGYTQGSSAIHPVLWERAEAMAGWLASISFKDGSIPHFNDSTDNIAPSTSWLLTTAGSLGLSISPIKLKDSGYRKFEFDGIEMIMDVHGISPSYQPGHAHADTFSFVLNYKDQPLIVDPGISTYDIGDRRSWERSTNAHNTIEVNGRSSSEVWAGFRVGRRAKVELVEDDASSVYAVHRGYAAQGILVGRRFSKKTEGVLIEDKLLGYRAAHTALSYLHFHPEAKILAEGTNIIKVNGEVSIILEGEVFSEIESYQYCLGYNKTRTAKRLKIKLIKGSCKIRIEIR